MHGTCTRHKHARKMDYCDWGCILLWLMDTMCTYNTPRYRFTIHALFNNKYTKRYLLRIIMYVMCTCMNVASFSASTCRFSRPESAQNTFQALSGLHVHVSAFVAVLRTFNNPQWNLVDPILYVVYDYESKTEHGVTERSPVLTTWGERSLAIASVDNLGWRSLAIASVNNLGWKVTSYSQCGQPGVIGH